MTTAGSCNRDLEAADYLRALHSLTREIERAIRAISQNALSDFEESVANQQMLSARLTRLANELCIPLRLDAPIAEAHLDADLACQIRAAGAALRELNRCYAALLHHASHSVALMASLFSSFQGEFQEASGPRLKHQTWSCQM